MAIVGDISSGHSFDPLAEVLPALTPSEAAIETNRCLYCFDAPCTQACPTHIDVPKFIKRISTGNLLGAAKTILDSNLLGATCARVCPVQELCEGACVLGKYHRPIEIGRLQRYALDSQTEDLFLPGPQTGRRIAVVGSGPAGLSCAGELARLGHSVVVFERKELPGGLSTYGIISLREPTEVALAEAKMIERLGVEFRFGVEPNPSELAATYDAVFLGVGMGTARLLSISGEEFVLDGLELIETSKLNPSKLTFGSEVVVIGAGNTAIDCATIAKKLGAERVTILYRRSESDMTAYQHEIDYARTEGIKFQFDIRPIRVDQVDGNGFALHCNEGLSESSFEIKVDQIIRAIGQEPPLNVHRTELGFVEVTNNFETNLPMVFAGGDCIRATGNASTVMAVQDGKLAAKSIHRALMGCQ